ncbi:MAG: hypothetical protein R3E65_00135 [Steroidobacteraceae bacterium]
MLSRWGASFTVGFLGLVASLPLLGYLAVVHRYAAQRPPVVFGSMLAVFVIATLSFHLVYALLPASGFRARIAGVLTALMTYVGVGTVYLFGVFAAREQIDTRFVAWVAFGLLLAGWYPTLCGLGAGWAVEGKIRAAAAEEP